MFTSKGIIINPSYHDIYHGIPHDITKITITYLALDEYIPFFESHNIHLNTQITHNFIHNDIRTGADDYSDTNLDYKQIDYILSKLPNIIITGINCYHAEDANIYSDLVHLAIEQYTHAGLYPLRQHTKLRHLEINWCDNLETLNDICNYKLRHLEIKCATHKLSKITGLNKCEQLESLYIACNDFVVSIDLRDCENLKKLTLNFRQPTNLSSFLLCENIRRIKLEGYYGDNLNALKCCKRLTYLNLTECVNLVNITDLNKCKMLSSFILTKCSKLTDISVLSACNRLKCLEIFACYNLIGMPKSCKKLQKIYVERCNKSLNLTGLSYYRCLRKLILYDCHELTDMSTLRRL